MNLERQGAYMHEYIYEGPNHVQYSDVKKSKFWLFFLAFYLLQDFSIILRLKFDSSNK